MSERSELYENDKVWARFYRDGKTLGEIATEFKCSIYSVSPWLASPLANAAFESARDIANVRVAKDAEIAQLREALQFYADGWRFTTNPNRAGLEWKPKEDLLDDCGNTARDALREPSL